MPTLRSATSTPTKKPATPIETTPASTPTPTKRCKTCQQPRLGHPRSGCPFGPTKNTVPDTADEVATALVTLNLNGPALEDTKAAVRNRRRSSAANKLAIPSSESLESLSTTSSSLLNNLVKPGLADTDEEDSKEKVVTWKLAYTPNKRLTRKDKQMLMPCSFDPPSAESSVASISFPESAPVIAPHTPKIEDEEAEEDESPAEEPITVDELLDDLAKNSDITLYRISWEEIPLVQSKAMKVGLFSHPVHNNLSKETETHGLLVIGRDGKQVSELAEKLGREGKSPVPARGGKGGVGFRTGMICGAVATFAGLAFS